MRLPIAPLFLLAGSTLASAHTGIGDTAGFVHGFSHPLGGLDHILAMVAVGMFAANLGGRAIWGVPLTFMALMAAGGALGIAGIGVPFVELGIALSIVVLGLAVAFRWTLPGAAAMALVGVFAIFHGHAHGTEMPADAAGVAYAAGFVAATGLLHLIGIGLGLGAVQLSGRAELGRRAVQVGGAAIAVLGAGMLFGAV